VSAAISQCGTYRYMLERAGDFASTKRAAFFLMLNPSTADGEKDDPTLRRCIDFAKRWGCHGLKVANLYAARATDPADLWGFDDPIGPDNDQWIYLAAREAKSVVVAWGVHGHTERVEQVLKILADARATLLCLGINKDGSPKHPLYLRKNSVLVPWSPRR
jgi:hypothetical protein